MRSKGAIGTLVLLVLVLLGGCAGIRTYNQLVEADEAVREAWANVQSAYQRRADLIPNLVETVRGAASFEQETLREVIEARARATQINLSVEDLADPQKVQQFQEAQQQLSGALSRLLVVAEQYPQLQSVEAFRDLMVQLEGTENRINVARQRYNEAVRRYNLLVRRFPGNIIARLTGFEPRVPFEAEAGAERAPRVQFD